MTDNKDKNNIPVVDPKLKKIFDVALKIPGVKVDRESFLRKRFPVSGKEDVSKLLKEGPVSMFTTSELSVAANKSINGLVTQSTLASFALGFPGGIAMGGTIPADIAQNMGLSIRLAQELGYIYGFEDIFTSKEELDEKACNTLLLYLGVMFGAQGAASLLRATSPNVAKYVSKQILIKPLTKGVFYPLLKKISAIVATKTLTKQVLAKSVSKTITVVGGFVSGGITLATMKPMAHRLKNELEKLVDISEEDIKVDYETIYDSADD